MGSAFGTYVVQEGCIQGYDGETQGKVATKKYECMWIGS
jgi:hypothetical protein